LTGLTYAHRAVGRIFGRIQIDSEIPHGPGAEISERPAEELKL